MSVNVPSVEDCGYEDATQFTFTVLKPVEGKELKPHLLPRRSCGCENEKCLQNFTWKEIITFELQSLICRSKIILEKNDVLQIKCHGTPICFYVGYFNTQYIEI